MNKRCILLVAGLSAIGMVMAAPSPANANLIANGDLASPALPSDYFYNRYFLGSTGIADWVVTSGAQDPGGGSVDLVGISYWPAPQNTGQSVNLYGSGPGGVSQTFATIVGAPYLVSFYMSITPYGGVGPVELDVSAGSAVLVPFTYTGATTRPNMDYALESVTFTAESDMTTLSFANADSLDNENAPVIGDVSVTAVPEPASLALLGAALLGFGALSRRRSRG